MATKIESVKPVLAFLVLLILTCDCQQYTIYIKPSESVHCPTETSFQCKELSTFVAERNYSSSMLLMFFPGHHYLHEDLEISSAKEFIMSPYHEEGVINITCYYKSFIFTNVSIVKIKSIMFHSCGGNLGAVQLRSVNHSEIINSQWDKSWQSPAIYINKSTTLISDCQLMRSNCSCYPGGGIWAVFSNITFTGASKILYNIVEESGGNGGGLYFMSSRLHLDGNLTIANNRGASGRGMFLMYSNFTTTQTSFLQIENNMCSLGHGGGLFFFKVKSFIKGYIVVMHNSAVYYGGGIYIHNSQIFFSGNLNFHNNSAAKKGGAMYIEKETTIETDNGILHYEVIIVASKNASFSQNSASNGAALYIDSINFTLLGVAIFENNIADDGGAISVLHGSVLFEKYSLFAGNLARYGCGAMKLYNTNIVFMKELHMIGNIARTLNGGGLCMHFTTASFYGNVTFVNNFAQESGGGLYADEKSNVTFDKRAVFFSNEAGSIGGSVHLAMNSNLIFFSTIKISSSSAGWAGGGIFVRSSILEMRSESSVQMCTTHFYGGAIALDRSELWIVGRLVVADNSAEYGGGIHAMASKLIITNNVSIERNFGQNGGGCSLSDSSLIYCSSENFINTIQFNSNYASQYGGAVWVEDIPFYSCVRKEPIQLCFFQFELWAHMNLNQECIFSLVNHSAILAGSNIYGGSVDNCIVTQKHPTLASRRMFNKIYRSTNESTHSSPISSDPMRVCLCTYYNKPDCSISEYTIEAYSGQQFPLTLVGVGQRNGTAPAVVLSHTDPPSNRTIKTTGGNCTTLFYAISSDSPSVALMLHTESSCNNISLLTVSVNIKPCPPGFTLHNETMSCTCDDTLMKLNKDIECDINSQSFAHMHGVWIDYNDLHRAIIYHLHCPFDYCAQVLSNFTFNNTDNQCRYNRTGLLCGVCKEGYSLTLGRSKCTQCSHLYLLVFLPLAVAGMVLVFFLLTFRFTVSLGIINGLILFANIVGTNSSIFIPPETVAFLRVFIAWLNLDLGISTCLFDGLDMYIKVWLQFIFPFYIFLLIGIIIIISHNSTLFTKFLGSDPVAVLATLILLAYTKLFHVILTVMSFTYIQFSDGSKMAVWLYDGNIKYLSGKHIPLFIFALLLFLLLILPYTVIMMFAPYLQRHSKNRILFWIDDHRLKPFLNSYYAPLKDKCRPWIGLLLILRLCLLLVFVSNSLGDPSVNLFAIIAVVVFLLCWRVLSGTFYKNWCLDAMELFFVMKLSLFSLATLYILNTSGNQKVLADILVGIVFIVFVLITVYHGWRQLTDSRWWKYTLKPKWQEYFNSKCEENQVFQRDGKEFERSQLRSQVPTTFIELRESLLESQ